MATRYHTDCRARELSLPVYLADACRVMRRSVGGASTGDYQLLRDMQRRSEDRRYRFQTLEALLLIGARCGDPEAVFAISEACRGFQLAAIARFFGGRRDDLFQALRLEDETNGPANIAALRFAWDRTPAARSAAIEAFMAQECATRRALDVLHADRGHDVARTSALVLRP